MKKLDFEHIDQPLLAVAVFHETNRRRIGNDLDPLGYKRGLREAARIQASGMGREEMISHQHPDESKETLSDRLPCAGPGDSMFLTPRGKTGSV